MPRPPNYNAIGLMSGTSMDGVDVALLTTDGHAISAFGPSQAFPYDSATREMLASVLGVGARNERVVEAERKMTERHADAVDAFLSAHAIDPSSVDVIGFHGHTIMHAPEAGRTLQIGDGGLLARMTGIDVVADFRSADVAAGGEGAPLAPLYHAALASGIERPLAVLNIGGVANVTWIGADEASIMAFDTGPGNALIDDWVAEKTGRNMDVDGALARSGMPDGTVIDSILRDPFFARRPPKSLDRDTFSRLAHDHLSGMSASDGAATLTALSAMAVALAGGFLPASPEKWLVCGGGRRNPVMMAALEQALDAPVVPVETMGWDGDALEAQAFAFLAVRSLRGLPLSLPGTTGVPRPVCGGVLFRRP
ncbi:MAG: anhydro-N-acetylmuramic acid kinase [Rhodospirillales bacterium]|nr:anhydro-N-acetylmuramic acid kinase [Rhodospirillales bacterium]